MEPYPSPTPGAATTRPLVVLVSGDREWTDVQLVRTVLGHFARGTILKHGDARGLDRIADRVGRELGFDVRRYPAQWDTLGRAAGVIRNQQMLDDEPIPDLVIGFHDDLAHSKGTRHMLNLARRYGYQPQHVFHA